MYLFYRVVCWSHVDRNCQEKTNGIPEETKDKIIADIHSIQIMPSTKAFEKAIELFFIKWESEESSLSKAFLEHFKKEWVDKNSGWYEGFSDGNVPSTDNGLESVNGKIKMGYIFIY